MIPAELVERHQWIAWRLGERGGKQTKLPVDPHTGANAKTNDPLTWGSYEDAVAAAARFACDGIGFVFSADDSYVGIDLDDCRDPDSGELAHAAQQLVEAFATYTETSVSGAGVHLILRGKMPAGRRHRGRLGGIEVEVYEQGRYFVMTGQALP